MNFLRPREAHFGRFRRRDMYRRRSFGTVRNLGLDFKHLLYLEQDRWVKQHTWFVALS